MSDSSVPLTLGEAMERGVVEVIETGDVEELVVRNLGTREIFIQSGDIVKGGKQDRVLIVSMILPPNSGRIPVAAFCVERGRWARRGQEKATGFSASTVRAPTKAIRAALAERTRREVASGSAGRGRGDLQYQVWESIRELQVDLLPAAGLNVADERSPSSLQLSLENTAIASALDGYGTALGNLAQEHPGAVGYIFAINGKISSGDEFGNADLFRKLWPRQPRAASTESHRRIQDADRQPTDASRGRRVH